MYKTPNKIKYVKCIKNSADPGGCYPPRPSASVACVAGGISRASALFFGSEAVNASGEAMRGLVKSRVEFPPAQIGGVF